MLVWYLRLIKDRIDNLPDFPDEMGEIKSILRDIVDELIEVREKVSE